MHCVQVIFGCKALASSRISGMIYDRRIHSLRAVFLHERLSKLTQQLNIVRRLAKAEALPEAVITPCGLKITPLHNSVPDAADVLIQQAYSLLPPIKITEWRVEVDKWTDFTRPFTPLKTGDLAKHKSLLLTPLLADAIHLGLSKMAESCSGTPYAKRAW